jgi:hypothetical protein
MTDDDPGGCERVRVAVVGGRLITFHAFLKEVEMEWNEEDRSVRREMEGDIYRRE